MILCDKIHGGSLDSHIRVIDVVYMEWEAAYKRLGRYTTKMGRDFALKLDKAPLNGINHGEILYQKDDMAIILEILPAPCMEIISNSIHEVAMLAYEIGNLHAPLFYMESERAFSLIIPKAYILTKHFYNRGLHIKERDIILDPKRRFSLSFALPREPRLSISDNFTIKIK